MSTSMTTPKTRSGAKGAPDQKTAGGLPVTPGGPLPGAPAPPRVYPRLLYRATDVYPGFEYVKVESPEDETKVLEDPERGLGWFDTPDEARLERARQRRPYDEFGRSIPEPVNWPAGTTAGVKEAATAMGEGELQKIAAEQQAEAEKQAAEQAKAAEQQAKAAAEAEKQAAAHDAAHAKPGNGGKK